MAAPGGKFFIQDVMEDVAPHHESFAKLWETKWKKPASMGVYPFMFSTVSDFQPVVDELIRKDLKEPYDWDEYASTFFPRAEELTRIAEQAEGNGEVDKASEFYLRASAVYRISRFPAPRSERQREAWKKGKEVCIKGLGLRPHPVREVLIPHTQRLSKEKSHIPAYYLHPSPHVTDTTPSSPAPLVIIFTGLDGYRTELAVWMESWRKNGVASMVLEIPGTGDCPSDPSDPKSPDRLYSSLFEWVGSQKDIAQDRVAVWGFSTGGYYSIRVAHTHHDKLAGSVSQGGGCHHMFSASWLSSVNHLEYPFDLADTLAHKFGYGTDTATFKKEALAKYSLLQDGTLDRKRCARLLLVNGTGDEIFPIDDCYVACEHGAPKELRVVRDTKHMGEPDAFFVILAWLYRILGVEADPLEQVRSLPFKAKYGDV
ncbi:pigment biosynthesis protein-like protein yellowish-green 1 [Pleomassaria siparia CBS 279.74]|uniref:Pigment biosynthesis protein-like protein yellowish-green 1 n=1 Tax=Pleomassaria siparia CBS 279.74 TaxID=1314801 RepID=A0A6G1KFP1_9PLEO|nr:pigment biosynthesis protein-like protein yellowish-green 1 [Pleomassaria siparia CBS 279.74]